MSEQQRVGHRSLTARHAATLKSRDKAKDKENITTTKKAAASIADSTTGLNALAHASNGRRVLRSKSANGLKVSSSSSAAASSNIFGLKESQLQPSLASTTTTSNSSANKARRVLKQPFSIFDSRDTQLNGDEAQSHHDSVTLQRSQSQIDKTNTLSRSSSALGSSFGSSLGSSINFKSSLGQARKIRSQLTIGVENDLADFFKKSKAQDQKQFGITNEDLPTNNTSENLQEITFTDEPDDITSMQRLLTERDSPLYERTHKVSVQALLSSSTGSDDIEETTFDYKDRDPKSEDGKTFMDLESLMMTTRSDNVKKEEKEDVELEIVSHNTNGIYNEEIPDSMEDMYAPMNTDLLSNLWGKPTASSLAAAEEFKSPMELDGAWRKDNLQDPKVCLEVGADEMKEPEDLLLEFSEDELLEFGDDNDDDEERKTDDKKLVEIMEFYQKERPAAI